MADSCCGAVVDVKNLESRQRQVLYVVLVVNALTFAMMLVASIQSRSTSLLSGGLDNLGDALTYALSIAVVGASRKAKARVALFKGLLVLAAAVAVAIQIALRIAHPAVPIFETIGVAGTLNLLANFVCLILLNPYRSGDVNMSSAWECSRNDVAEGCAVIAAACGVWFFGKGWPDLVIGSALLLLFVRSALRIFQNGIAELRNAEMTVTAPIVLPIVSVGQQGAHCQTPGCCERR